MSRHPKRPQQPRREQPTSSTRRPASRPTATQRPSSASLSGEIEVAITDLARDGSGVGIVRGTPVQVAATILGERVVARVIGKDGNATLAEGVRLLEASADRVAPECDSYLHAPCALCRWQHITSEAQLLLKQDLLLSALASVSGGEAAVRPVLPAPAQWGYLQRYTFPVAGEPPRLHLPARPQGGEKSPPVPFRECALIHPDLLNFADQLDLELTGIRAVTLAQGDDGEPMITLELASEEAPELELDFAASVNALTPDNQPFNMAGDTYVRYQLGERRLRVTAGSYYRANTAIVPLLAQTVRDLLAPQPNDHILDLGAGVGTFSVLVAPLVRLLTLVESYPPAATDADENLADFDNVTLIEGSVDELLTALDEPATAAIVDLPSGIARSAGLLAGTRVERIVLVSSAPATLARDAAALAKQGFRLVAAQPVDTMPNTHFFDTVALFRR